MYRAFIVVEKDSDRGTADRLFKRGDLGVEVTGVFHSGLEALQEARLVPPDIVLIDRSLRAMEAQMLGRRLKECSAAIHLIFAGDAASVHDRGDAVGETNGFFYTTWGEAELSEAIRRAVRQADAWQHERQRHEERGRLWEESLSQHQERYWRSLLTGAYREQEANVLRQQAERLHIVCHPGTAWQIVLLREEADSFARSGPTRLLELAAALETPLQKDDQEQRGCAVFVADQLLAIVVGADERDREPLLQQVLETVCAAELSACDGQGMSERRAMEPLSVAVGSAVPLERLAEEFQCVRLLLEDNAYSDMRPRIALRSQIGAEPGAGGCTAETAEPLFHALREMIYGDDAVDGRLIAEQFGPGSRENAGWTDSASRTFIVRVSAQLQRLYVEAGISVNGFILSFLSIWNKLSTDAGQDEVEGAVAKMAALARAQLLEEQRELCDSVVKTMKRTIMKHYAEPLSVVEIAEQAHLVPSRASCLFRYKTGRKLLDYLNEYRVEKAKSLIREGETELERMASQSGHTGAAHLQLSFIRHEGQTIEQYRRSLGAGQRF